MRRCAAAAGSKGVDRRLLRRAQRGREAEQQARGDRHRERERKNRRADVHVRSAGQIAQRGGRDVHEPEREHDAERAAAEGEHGALGAEPSQQITASGAECRAHGGLVRARRRAHEQQVGDVRARDQQNQGDRSREHHQGRARPADCAIAQRRHAKDALGIRIRVAEIRARVATRDRIGIRLHVLNAHARRQPRDSPQVSEPAGDLLPREAVHRLDVRRPHVHVVERRRQIDAERADDRMRCAVQRQRGADGVGPHAEAARPEAAREDHYGRTRGSILFVRDASSGRHRHAEHVKEAAGDTHAGQLLGRRSAAREIERVVAVRRHAREHAAPRGEILIRRERDRRVAHVALRIRMRERHDAVRVAERQRPQQDGVDDAEDGGGGADADRDHRDRDDRKPRRLDQRSCCTPHLISPLLPYACWHAARLAHV